MKIGAVMFFTTDSMQPAPLGRALEERGFESLWVPEHTHIPSSLRSAYPASGGLVRAYYEIMDPFLALNTAAAVTTTLRIGTGIALVTQRDPIAAYEAGMVNPVGAHVRVRDSKDVFRTECTYRVDPPPSRRSPLRDLQDAVPDEGDHQSGYHGAAENDKAE
jgi:hypothetical protein